MSQENVEIVRALFEDISRLMAAGTADPQRSLQDDYTQLVDEFLATDFELVPATSAVERRVLHGHEGFATFLEGGRDAWRDAQLEASELVDLGARILVLATFRAKGRASGAAVEQPNATIWTVHGGRVTRGQLFMDPTEGLAAAGLADGESVPRP